MAISGQYNVLHKHVVVLIQVSHVFLLTVTT